MCLRLKCVAMVRLHMINIIVTVDIFLSVRNLSLSLSFGTETNSALCLFSMLYFSCCCLCSWTYSFSLRFILLLFSLSLSISYSNTLCLMRKSTEMCVYIMLSLTQSLLLLSLLLFFPALQRFKKVNDGSQPKCIIKETVLSLCCFVHILMKLNLKYQLCSFIFPYNIFRCKVCNCSSSLYLSNVILMIQRETIAHYQAKNYKREYLNGNHLKW